MPKPPKPGVKVVVSTREGEVIASYEDADEVYVLLEFLADNIEGMGPLAERFRKEMKRLEW